MKNSSNDIKDFGLSFDFSSMKPGTLFTTENICLTGFQIRDFGFEYPKNNVYVLPYSIIMRACNTDLSYTATCDNEALDIQNENYIFAHAEKYYIKMFNGERTREENQTEEIRAEINLKQNPPTAHSTHMPIVIKHICSKLSNSSLLFVGTRVFGLPINRFNYRSKHKLNKKRLEKRLFGEFLTGAGRKIYLDNSQIMKVRSLTMLTDAFEAV